MRQQRVDFLPRGVEGAAVQLHRADAIGQVSPATRRLERTQQPPHGSQHKRTAAKRRLQQAHAVQRLAGGVPGQIEHELHHLGPGVDRPPPVSVQLAGERVHGIGYWAEALEGGLVNHYQLFLGFHSVFSASVSPSQSRWQISTSSPGELPKVL